MESESISRDFALSEFERFMAAMDLESDVTGMKPDAREQFEQHRELLVQAIQDGHLAVNDGGEPVYTPHRPASGYKQPITFHERKGADILASDNAAKKGDVHRMYAVLGSMCGLSPSVFSGLAGKDLKIVESIFVLLMG